MSVVSASKSLTVMDGCLALSSSRQECVPKRSAAVVCLVGASPVFRSLVSSSSALLLASNSLWASMRFRRRNGVHRVSVTASASEWEQEERDGDQQEEPEEGEGYEEAPEPYEPYTEPPEGAKLFVGNLPFDVDSEQLAGVFEKAGIVEVVEVIYDRETNRSRGFAFVTMSTVEEAEKAIEMLNQYELSGRLLTVNKAAPRGSRVERPPRFGGDTGSSNRLYVGNLPWGADDTRLGELFSEHGKVLEARIVYDRETGRSRGFGFVTLSSPSEVDDAIASLDGADFEGRPLRVNIAEERPRRVF